MLPHSAQMSLNQSSRFSHAAASLLNSCCWDKNSSSFHRTQRWATYSEECCLRAWDPLSLTLDLRCSLRVICKSPLEEVIVSDMSTANVLWIYDIIRIHSTKRSYHAVTVIWTSFIDHSALQDRGDQLGCSCPRLGHRDVHVGQSGIPG